MIARFVDDLLLAIGEASIDELRQLFASRPESLRPLSVVRSEVAAAAASAGASAGASTATPGRARAKASRRWSVQMQLPLAVEEITDPEALLSLDSNVTAPVAAPSVAAPAAPPRPTPVPRSPVVVSLPTRIALAERGASEPEGESPASGVRPVGSGPPVRLSDNETLARVSNAGVVIRRKKKA